jgi:hypothetical protein
VFELVPPSGEEKHHLLRVIHQLVSGAFKIKGDSVESI